ncbi:hypothetical protein RUM44_007823 [Polyplax serrata]|uniref:Uncharacterized protein n=1 Tax=Polyplax serrata TaxID=468196 RepID=A0ABR1BAM3_POLSC
MASSLASSVVLVLLVVVTVVFGAPFEKAGLQQSAPGKAECDQEHSEVYDQRQNGTENYRIHLNGVVVLVAPAETVIQAAQLANLDGDLDNLLMASSGDYSTLKPKPRPPSPGDKVSEGSESKPQNQTYQKDLTEKKLKLINLLRMFRNIRHEVDGSYPSTPSASQ